MKTAHVVILVICTALVSAFATGVIFFVLAAMPVGEMEYIDEPRPVIVAETVDGNDELLARVDRLTMRNSDLQQRLDELEQRSAGSERTPLGNFASQSEFEELRDEVRALQASSGVAPEEPEIFKEQIAGALSEIRREETIEKLKQYQEKRVARLDQDLEKMRTWLELEEYQVNEVRDSLVDQYAREDEQRQLWEAGESDEILAERKRADGQLFWDEMRIVLTPEQYDTFWASVSSRSK